MLHIKSIATLVCTVYCLQINQIMACLSEEHHLPGSDSTFLCQKSKVGLHAAQLIADSLHVNNPEQVLSKLPLKIIILLLTSMQVEKFV